MSRLPSVTIDDTELRRKLDEALDDSTRSMLHRMEEEAQDIYLRVLGSWPEKTGRTKADFFNGTRVVNTARQELIQVFVGNENTARDNFGDPYLYKIRPPGGGTAIWTTMVRRPMMEAGNRLADDLTLIVAQRFGAKP